MKQFDSVSVDVLRAISEVFKYVKDLKLSGCVLESSHSMSKRP
jgi:hypothetical protein